MERILTSLKPGQKAKILRLEGGHGFQRKLRTLGVREGKIVKLIAGHPLGGPLVVEVERRQTVTIGRGMAHRIIVEVL